METALKNRFAAGALFALLGVFGVSSEAFAARQFEYLDRGVVAVRQSKTNALVTWRSLATDEDGLGFNVYRTTDGKTVKLNTSVLTGGTNFSDGTADFTKANTYFVKKVLNGVELETKGSYTMPANKAIGAYITVPVEKIDASSTVHFVWVGDLDGDGAYDYVLDQPALNHQQLQAYTSAGKYLWTLDLGANSENKNNISPGASTIDVGMWDGATVYDIDSDGFAEVIVRIADGVTFGDGKKYGNSKTNAQAIAVLDGKTGALKYSADVPTDYLSVGPLAVMMEVGYLDGKTPSLVCWMKNRNADKSFNSMTVAYHVSNGKLVQQWKYDANKKGGGAEAHQIRIADVDYDGKDEVLHQGYALNGDGTLRYQIPLINHGDRWYVGAFNKDDNVMMGYGIQQDHPQNLLEYYYNASTGEILWTHYGDASCNGQCDVGRGTVGDIDPNYDGLEAWSFQGTYHAGTNTKIADNYLYPVLRYWWDGDLGAESYNEGKIEKWNYDSKTITRVNTTWKVYASSGSDRGVAMFHGDVFGDWREESILVNYANKELVIFTTDIASDERIYSLMQNPCYRNGTTTKGYVQSSMLDYFLGYGMSKPSKPDIEIIGGDREASFTARSFVKKCGAGGSRQTLNPGDSLKAFCYSYGNGSVSAEGFPDWVNVNYSTYNGNTEIWFSGKVPDNASSGEYAYTVKVSGGVSDTTASGKITVVEASPLSSSSVEGNFSSSSSNENISSSSSNGESSGSSDETALEFSRTVADWTLEQNGGTFTLQNGSSVSDVRLFDVNGKFLGAKKLAAGESWELPLRGRVMLMQVHSAGTVSVRRLSSVR